MSARVADLRRALDGAVLENGWHGPTVLEAASRVDDETGARRVPGASHTIAELVEHIRFWEAVCLHHATAGALPRPTHDWSKDAPALSEAVRNLRVTHADLMAAVDALDDAALDRQVPVEGGTMRLVDVLHGAAAHAAYHGGQIRLLHTLLGG